MRSLRFVAIVSVAMAVVMSEPIGASGIKTMKGRRAEKMKLNDRQQQRRMKKTFDGATVTKMAKDGDRRGPPQDAYAQSDGGRGRGNSKTSSEARGAPKRVSTTGRTPLPALQLRGRTPRPQPSGDEQESPAVEQGRSNPDAPGQSGPGPGSPQNQNQGNPQNPPRATSSPTRRPTLQPTNPPTPSPTAQPTKSPTRSPTPPPTDQPTNSPTRSPTPPPTPKPTDSPTKRPTPAPVPAGSPQDNIPVPQNPVIPSSTESPTKSPTDIPTPSPTPVPTPTPPIPATGLSAPDQSDAPDEYQFIRDAIVANGFAGLTMPQNADEGSYVRSALDWISSENNPSSLSDEQLVQRYALACIYYATYGVPNDLTALRDGQGQTPEGWPYDAGWMTDEDECSWEGIVCDDRGEVEAIELYSNELTGHFPNECVLLKESLKKLDLYDNIYMNNVGKEQHDFLGELTGLELLWLSDTGMEYDGVPEALGNLVNLIELDCGYMSWFGELDGTIFSNMRDLEMLLLSGNLFFESIIPTELGLLPDLAYVYLDDCNMGGDLSALPSIKGGVEFMFGDNPGIGGTIPSNLDEVEYLEVLSAYNCSLTGSIPESIGNIENLAEIELYINDLTGPIPSSIGGLTDLVIFYFDGNNDIDGIPEEICRITENDGFDSMTANCLQGCTCCTECY